MFELISKFKPTGDQPKAIEKLVQGIKNHKQHQVLLGVTGSGKTFTMANVIAQLNRPVLVLSHNKTLALQLFTEFKEFFPHNRVEYFVSYFDFYRPEAYLPAQDVYIDKTSKTNLDLEAMRMSTLNALTMRRDTIVVSSVASIYGAYNPKEYKQSFINIEINQKIKPSDFAIELVKRQYKRNQVDTVSGSFMVKGDVFIITPAWTDSYLIKIDFFGDVIEKITKINPVDKKVLKTYIGYTIFPASAYSLTSDTIEEAIKTIETELDFQLNYFEKEEKLVEKQRLKERVLNDIDSLREFGFCNGIENYSRHIDQRQAGEKPYTLLDYLPKDAIIFIDESHMMIPQLNAMYEGDRSRKSNLVDYGFRLPSALDNRPLKFEEFEEFQHQKIYISATPADYEIDKADGEVIQQIIRPTGLLDPVIEVKPTINQVDFIYDLLQEQKVKNERTLILTTTKRSSEELSKYLQSKKQKVYYIHSEFTTFEREAILIKLRKGIYDAVIGINLLREGIDLPEVSLIIVLDADKESFFRSKTSLIQIIGRAARNDHGKVIFFADKITKSMQAALDDNHNKRDIQQKYNKENNITPKTILKPIVESIKEKDKNAIISLIHSKTKKDLKEKQKLIDSLRKQMKEAAKEEDYEKALQLQQVIFELEGS
ncbi:excinuclease ABC subunit UvrB [Mycoplasma sp. 1654_15]|uniref:excinuclease ABC subunit UvrB n=1 Tax=Mycoplasma sp. 1654_15 TaxID=2725994 RepID=UPI0014496A07|nr:excinuclease ABC subunit UvrB [Mycoplasma sp. 1654_15]QJB70955.1 excinuclease ABC subunit UvrB [Mycoplasma sp. 1654_15]